MLKTAALTFALTMLFVAGANAAEPPASVEDCLKAAIGLAETAEGKTLADEARTKVESDLIALEGHCEANRFPEAGALIAEIESRLSGS